MKKEDQKAIAMSVCLQAAQYVQNCIDRNLIPETWEGIELRQYLSSIIIWKDGIKGKRAKTYNNDILINGL